MVAYVSAKVAPNSAKDKKSATITVEYHATMLWNRVLPSSGITCYLRAEYAFYRLPENVAGCYAQKPLKSIERIVKASSKQGDLITDFFAHSGTTLIVGEMSKRKVFIFDIDPIFAELTIRRLEHFRKTGAIGFQFSNPFPEITDFIIEQQAIQETTLEQKPLVQTTFLKYGKTYRTT